jgi:hypothetical protein
MMVSCIWRFIIEEILNKKNALRAFSHLHQTTYILHGKVVDACRSLIQLDENGSHIICSDARFRIRCQNIIQQFLDRLMVLFRTQRALF